MRKSFFLLLSAMLLSAALMTPAALAEEAALSVDAPTETIRPGKGTLLTFSAPIEGEASLYLTGADGGTVSLVVEGFAAVPGQNALMWNGTCDGVPAPEGVYRLTVAMGDMTASAPVIIGPMAPYMTGIRPSAETLTFGETLTVDFYASVDGLLTLGVWQGERWTMLGSQTVTEGENAVSWDGAGMADGDCAFTLTLTDGAGFSSNEEHIALTLTGFSAALTAAPTPAATVPPTVPPTNAPTLAATELPTLAPVQTAAPTEIPEVIVEEITLDTPPAASSEEGTFTPAYGSPYNTDTSLNYWTLPMDITNEAAIWEVLTQPITVVDTGKKNAEKTQVTLRAEPSSDSAGVGVVTCITQGVHVLETLDNGWSLVECYSSSFHDSKVKYWNMLVQGYIETDLLKTTQPSTEYGIVIDKLTQRLYLFKEGRLYSTLLVSTGLTNAKQPYNETRSGEFLLTSAVGAFASGNLTCGMAIRFNDGDLLHEVPHSKNADGTKNYGYEEPKLGTKASHGCIRVQRKRTPEGINMQWLWNNRERNTRLLIWEDWQGRQIEIPEDSFTLYYNADGGSYYHSKETCYSVQREGVTFTTFSYGELDEKPYSGLKRCPYCAPVLRRAEIEAINEVYAPGGDHDPILTAARAEQLGHEDGEE